MKVTLGPGQVKKTSVMEMYEEYKTEEGGQLLFNDGTLVIPVVDYLKAKLKIKSVETVERMERELNLMHQDLIGKGSTEEEVKNVIKASEKYAKYQKLMSEIAEVIVKEALEGLAIPGLIIRSVVKLDVWRRCSQLYLKAGISLSGLGDGGKIGTDFKKDEYDLQMVFADGDTLNWILVEVKNSNSYPWESTVSPPNPSLFEGNLQKAKRNPKKARKVGSWGQLAKSFTFLSELFADIPFGKVLVFTAMPNMPRHVLEKELKPECMEMILCQEDLADPKELRRRLGLDKMAPPTEIGRNKVCIVGCRMVGPGSGLYIPLRSLADVRSNEEKQLKTEMEEVDKDTWVILDNLQEAAIEKAENEGKRIIAIEGPPGCGKTLTGEQICKRMIEKAKTETGEDPMVIITKNLEFKEGTPLRQQLEANAEQGSQVVEWGKLLKKNGVERVRIEGRNKDYTYYNLPEEFAALGEKLVQAEQGKRKIIIMMDETLCNHSPEDKEQASYNWTGLEKIPDQVTIILMFNPGFYHGRHLLLPPSCLRLVLETTYRSTKSISNLHACLVTAIKFKAPAGNPGTEVVGELPRLVPLGDLGEEEEAAEKIKQGLKLMREFMGEEDVTVIIDGNPLLSDNIAKLVREETEKAWGWKMRTYNEMIGAEADRVVYIGRGSFESLSRARISLGILLCCQTELSKGQYNIANVGFQTAIEEGLVLVATLPSHPQISTLTNILSTGPPPPPAAESQNPPDLQQFCSWKGKAAAQILLPDVEEEDS